MAVKNFWSLNVDEAIVADKLQNELKKSNWEVFFPLRSQLKDIDLLLVNLKSKKTLTIQVKGSRTYTTNVREIEQLGEGRTAWFTISKTKIFDTYFPVDYFIFLIHTESSTREKQIIELHYLVMPINELQGIITKTGKRCNKDGNYDFYFRINTSKKSVCEHRERNNMVDYSKYLNNFDGF